MPQKRHEIDDESEYDDQEETTDKGIFVEKNPLRKKNLAQTQLNNILKE